MLPWPMFMSGGTLDMDDDNDGMLDDYDSNQYGRGYWD